jgi:hypothetical protein
MTQTNGIDLDEEGIYRLAAAVMMAPGSAKRRRLPKKAHYAQLAWLKGPCGAFWMGVMGLIPDQVASRYAITYGVRGGPALECVTGACKRHRMHGLAGIVKKRRPSRANRASRASKKES